MTDVTLQNRTLYQHIFTILLHPFTVYLFKIVCIQFLCFFLSCKLPDVWFPDLDGIHSFSETHSGLIANTQKAQQPQSMKDNMLNKTNKDVSLVKFEV